MKSNIFICHDLRFHARALAFLAALAMTSYSSPAQTNAAPAERIEGYKEHLIAGSKWYQHDPDRPQPPAHLEAVDIGELEVEDDRVG